MKNRAKQLVLILAAYIMYGCTYELAENTEDVMKRQGWSTSGKLITASGKKVNIQAVFPETGTYTAQFSIGSMSTIATGDDVFKATAEITWSVEGNSVRRVVNCANGMSVTGTAQAVNIVISDDSTLDGTAPFEYDVSVQIVPGTRSSVQQPPFLEDDIQLVAPAASVDVTIPVDAGVISVYVATMQIVNGTPIEYGDIKVIHLSGSRDLKQYDPRDGIWIPISPGADKIRLINVAGSPASIRFTPVWGIDG